MIKHNKSRSSGSYCLKPDPKSSYSKATEEMFMGDDSAVSQSEETASENDRLFIDSDFIMNGPGGDLSSFAEPANASEIIDLSDDDEDNLENN